MKVLQFSFIVIPPEELFNNVNQAKTMQVITTQYDQNAQVFAENQKIQNQANRQDMYAIVGTDIFNKKLLDLCCGDGIDCDHYQKQGAHVIGLDASAVLISIGKQTYPEVSFVHAYAQKTPFQDNEFDIVTSKYAIMTNSDMQPTFNEACRVLKPGGVFVYLVTHPIRQFFEKKKADADYFKQETVESIIFEGQLILNEPTHTFNEYFNKDFFKKFTMVDYHEGFDPTAEQISGARYPGYFIVKAIKKLEL